VLKRQYFLRQKMDAFGMFGAKHASPQQLVCQPSPLNFDVWREATVWTCV
jgi:hypothetical protein